MKMIKATSAYAVGGRVVRAGETRRLDDKLAEDLIRRGKAVLVTAESETDAQGATKPKRAAKKEGPADAG